MATFIIIVGVYLYMYMYAYTCKIECDTILPSPSAVTEAGKTGDPYARTFFQKEYTLNHLIGNNIIPLI